MADREDESSLSAEEQIARALDELGAIVDSQADRLTEKLAPVNRSVEAIERKLEELGFGPARPTDRETMPRPDNLVTPADERSRDGADADSPRSDDPTSNTGELDPEEIRIAVTPPDTPVSETDVAGVSDTDSELLDFTTAESQIDEEPEETEPQDTEPEHIEPEGTEPENIEPENIEPAGPEPEDDESGFDTFDTDELASGEDETDVIAAGPREESAAAPPPADLPFETEGLSEDDLSLADESLKSELVNLFDDGAHATRHEPALDSSRMAPPIPSVPQRSRPIYLLVLALIFLAGSIGIGAFVWFELTSPEQPVAINDGPTTETATTAPTATTAATPKSEEPASPPAKAPSPPPGKTTTPAKSAANGNRIAALPEPELTTEAAPAVTARVSPDAPASDATTPSATTADTRTQTEGEKPTPASVNPEIDALRDLAAAGDSVAQNELAIRYLVGRGIEQDYTKAARWLQEAAAGGVVSAQYNLGVLYDSGRGVESDPIEALIWFHSAAEKGHGRAQYALAAAYAAGRGIARDSDIALKWLRRAAGENIVEAQSSLANILATSPVSQDSLTDAYYWYRLADANGDSKAGERAERVAARLTPEERADVNRRVSAFIAANITGKRARPAPAATPSAPAPPAPPAPPVSTSGVQSADAPAADTSEQVRTIQTLLTTLGFETGPADGALDAQTRDAIRNYQRALGLVMTGEPSDSLLAHLRQISGLRK